MCAYQYTHVSAYDNQDWTDLRKDHKFKKSMYQGNAYLIKDDMSMQELLQQLNVNNPENAAKYAEVNLLNAFVPVYEEITAKEADVLKRELALIGNENFQHLEFQLVFKYFEIMLGALTYFQKVIAKYKDAPETVQAAIQYPVFNIDFMQKQPDQVFLDRLQHALPNEFAD